MFILSFPSKEIQKFLAVNSNLEKLEIAIKRIKNPFKTKSNAKVCAYSVLNSNKERAQRSFERFKGLPFPEEILFFAEFKKRGKGGGIILFIGDKARVFTYNGLTFRKKDPRSFFEGTWEEVIIIYLKILLSLNKRKFLKRTRRG